MAKRRRWRIIWTESAARDLNSIVAHIALDSKDRARDILSRLRASAGTLREMPRRGRVVPELASFGVTTWRELIVSPYRIIFRLAEPQVEIRAVVDGRRDLQDVLLERLIRPD